MEKKIQVNIVMVVSFKYHFVFSLYEHVAY